MSEHTPLTEAEQVELLRSRMVGYEDGTGGWLFREATGDELIAVVNRILAARTSTTATADTGVTSTEPGCTCGGIAACIQCQERDATTADTGHLYAPCKGREDALDELSGHAFNVWCETNEDTQDDEVIDLFRREFAPWLDRIVDGAADDGLRERVEALVPTVYFEADGSIADEAVPVAELRAALDVTAAPTIDTEEKS